MSQRIKLLPLGSAEQFNALTVQSELTLRQLLAQAPAAPVDSVLHPEWLDQPLRNFILDVQEVAPAPRPAPSPPAPPPRTPPRPAVAAPAGKPARGKRPETLTEHDAVRCAYGAEIQRAASFLRAGLSVLVLCDKLVVESLRKEIALRARLEEVVIQLPERSEAQASFRNNRQRQLEEMRSRIRNLRVGDVLVLPHLDLLAGGASNNLTLEAGELIEVVYQAADRLLLAFADRSLPLPEVLVARFSVRIEMMGLQRKILGPDDAVANLEDVLVTSQEAAHFTESALGDLFKNVAGMNPVQLRHAIRYAVQDHATKEPFGPRELARAIQVFKVQTSSHYELPEVEWDLIGGYDDVKAELKMAAELLDGAHNLPEKLQRELIPRGFIFHGPPGTGKTLFAKAIATMLRANIQVVSGPEVTNMYVGESERKVRELFLQARRNAPAVLVFDEFDTIATQRTGRDDGGSRASNAVVGQILTEMDGFRPDVKLLVIGTTNRLDIIDEALLRPARFRAIHIGLPTLEARRRIAEVHAEHFGIKVPPSLLGLIAEKTEGFNGDEIRSLFRDACVDATVRKPPIPVSAHRLGMLVGLMEKAREDKAATRARHGRQTQPAPAQASGRHAPPGPGRRLQPRSGGSNT
jgi:transitional endoplasmic reticulum ATPase